MWDSEQGLPKPVLFTTIYSALQTAPEYSTVHQSSKCYTNTILLKLIKDTVNTAQTRQPFNHIQKN